MNVLLISADRTSSSGVPINLGDALLTDVLASAVRARGATVEVADFGSVRTVGNEARLHLKGIAGLFGAIRSADCVVVGGGTLFQDDTPGQRFAGLPRLMFAVSILGWAARTPVLFFGVGCDPIAAWGARLLLRLAVFRRAVWVRDAESQRRCWTLLGCRAVLAADVSLLGRDQLLHIAAEPGKKPRNRLAIALNRSHADVLTPDLMTALRAEFESIIFVQMDQGDTGDALTLSPKVRERFDEVTAGLTWSDAVEYLAGSRVVLASRMHAMYITAMINVPTAAISGAAKVDAFIDEFGISGLATVDGWDGTAQSANCASVESAGRRVETQLDALMTLARSHSTQSPRRVEPIARSI